MNKLPNKLSDLLRLAVRDAQACEADPKYKLEMETWHCPSHDGRVCFVCMAGAVMAKTQGIPAERLVVTPDAVLFKYIDLMRLGRISGIAQGRVAREFRRIVDDGYLPRLKRADWATYLCAADYLESEGL